MIELESVATWPTPTSCAFPQTKPQTITDDPLAGLNLDEIAIDASNGNFDILVDEALFGDSNTFSTSWNAPAQTITLDGLSVKYFSTYLEWFSVLSMQVILRESVVLIAET